MLSSSKSISPTLIETPAETQLIDPKDKVHEIQGTFEYDDKRFRIIRDLTEIHEATWRPPDNKVRKVHVKHLRYVTIIEGDIHLSIGEKRIQLKRILGQMIKWTSLKNPNILPYLGYQWRETPMLVFSWYKNGNMSEYAKGRPEPDRLKLLVQASQGLAFLHSQSIVHGDIKPSNVIIADDGHAMLMDFGMAPDLRTVERNITIANPDTVSEWTGYMSPELIEEGDYTNASDVYAFAALILEIMSGQRPFYKLHYVQAMVQITHRNKPSPEDHQALPSSSPLWDLMQCCWKATPADRPSMDQVCSVLESVVGGNRSWLFRFLGSLLSFVFRVVGPRRLMHVIKRQCVLLGIASIKQ